MTKILTVDDSDVILKMVEGILNAVGYTSLTALSGSEGLDKAVNDKPDAILLDRQMPEMDGYEVLMELKANEVTNDIPVIMFTGDKRVSDVSSCFELGAVDYIVKPFDAENLIIRINKVLSQSSVAE